jgi:hypothetical protein
MSLPVMAAMRHIRDQVDCGGVKPVGATIFVHDIADGASVGCIDGDVVKQRELCVVQERGNEAKIELRNAAPLA